MKRTPTHQEMLDMIYGARSLAQIELALSAVRQYKKLHPEDKIIFKTAELLVMTRNSLLLSGLERIPDNPPE